jgi:NAD(P)-dependent dehydrogenase (short-subunit alcohol dehydrogenase family)
LGRVLDSFGLWGKRIVVTGASGGLGRAVSLSLGEAGADLVLLARDGDRLEETKESIASGIVSAVSVATVDITRPDAVEEVFARVTKEWPPDVLVNCAGQERESLAIDLSDADWRSVLDANLSGTFYCCRAFGRVAGEGSAIVNFASIAATVGVPTQSAYCASKGGVAALTRALALEFAPRGIRVNAIAPGYFSMGMPSRILSDSEARSRLIRRIPLGRLGEGDDIGPVALFLASEASRFMTGTVLYLDGGYTAR